MATPIPANSARFTVRSVLEATRADWLGTSNGTSDETPCNGVTTDSRSDVVGKLFVALAGENFDAHRFVPDVIARGAWGVLVERAISADPDTRLFQVPSTLEALGSLAHLHRRRWGGKLVTIGGSAGKTTTRVAVATLLEWLRPKQVHCTAGNLNNLVGVPMTLLGIEPRHELAVVEVGTNRPGEVLALAAMCQANVAVLTCIGLEHCAGLGDLDGVEAEEAALFGSMPAPAVVIGQHDDARVLRQLQAASRLTGASIRTYGVSDASTYRIVERGVLDLLRSRLRILRKLGVNETEVVAISRLCGLPGALATAAAIAVADAVLGPLEAENFVQALDRDVGEAGRLRILERSDRALVIDDCYNANPVSMQSSVIVAKELAQSRNARFNLVIGDMLELGDLSVREHEALIELVEGATNVVAVGREVGVLVAAAGLRGMAIAHFDSADQAIDHVRSLTQPGDVVLVKGSRGMRLERIVRSLVGGEGYTQ